MSSIVIAVFKLTIGLLGNRFRDKLADSLEEGGITDQKCRDFIIREIKEIKSKLDGLARKDLLASISFFNEGIKFLYEKFDEARPKGENNNAVTTVTQAATAMTCATETFSLTKGISELGLGILVHQHPGRYLGQKTDSKTQEGRRRKLSPTQPCQPLTAFYPCSIVLWQQY